MPKGSLHNRDPQSDVLSTLQMFVRLIARQAARDSFAEVGAASSSLPSPKAGADDA